jgi:Txe/YoeB family toxin of Txe-Axe toxin-antitoxin module
VIRDRLHAKYDADDIRQSWITLTETDPMSLIRICCQLPFRADGKTDPIARTVMETYVTRLTHEKYAVTYQKVVNSLRTMFHAKPDSPTLLNFAALVKWVSPESATKLCADVGMPEPTH